MAEENGAAEDDLGPIVGVMVTLNAGSLSDAHAYLAQDPHWNTTVSGVYPGHESGIYPVTVVDTDGRHHFMGRSFGEHSLIKDVSYPCIHHT
jgi:hypothetical protein